MRPDNSFKALGALTHMRAVKTSLIYCALVFGTGFLLGTGRVTVLVPLIGVRLAELVELPVMVLVSYIAAAFTVRRFGPFNTTNLAGIGLLALLCLVAAELGLTVASGQSIGGYIASRDPISGSAYLVSLLLFAVMPVLVGHRSGT